MNKQFITVDLTPGFKENKSTTRIIYLIISIVIAFSLVYSFFYVPLITVNNEIEKQEAIQVDITAQRDFLWMVRNGTLPNEEDILIDNTLDYIETTQINLQTRLASISSIDIEGVGLGVFDYDHSHNLLNLVISVESDEALLSYIERLWDVYWIDRVEYSTAGPGAIEITVHFTIGEVPEDE